MRKERILRKNNSGDSNSREWELKICLRTSKASQLDIQVSLSELPDREKEVSTP